jgi:hypothetical protein
MYICIYIYEKQSPSSKIASSLLAYQSSWEGPKLQSKLEQLEIQVWWDSSCAPVKDLFLWEAGLAPHGIKLVDKSVNSSTGLLEVIGNRETLNTVLFSQIISRWLSYITNPNILYSHGILSPTVTGLVPEFSRGCSSAFF